MQNEGRRFEIAMWSYLAVVIASLGYGLWKAVGFFSALREAQFQFAPMLSADGVDGYVPFTNGVIASWPERLAAYPATLAGVAGIAWTFVIMAAAFRLSLVQPQGVPVPEKSGSEGPRQVFAEARALARFDGPLLERTDGAEFAAARGQSVYLPAGLAGQASRRYRTGAARRIAFVIVHETWHSSTSDNVLWSLGRVIAVVTTGVIGALLLEPLMLIVTMLLPTVAGAPYMASAAVAVTLTAGILVVTGLVTSGLLPALTAGREFFADKAAAARVGIDGFPYEDDEAALPTLLAAKAWRMGASNADRRLHMAEVAPASNTMAAFAVGTWVLVRTVLLIVDQEHGFLVGLIFDVTAVICLVAMLASLPRRRLPDARRQDLLAWVLTALLIVLMPSLFWGMRSFMATFRMTQVISLPWLLDLSVPPVVAAACILLWNQTAAVQPTPADASRTTRPRTPNLRLAGLFLLALPSYVGSYALILFAIINSATTLGSWSSGEFGRSSAEWQNAVVLPVALAAVALVARNMIRVSSWALAVELGLVAIAGGIMSYIAVVMALLASSASSELSGFPVDVAVAEQTLMAFPRGPVLFATALAVTLLVILALPYWARYRLRLSGA